MESHNESTNHLTNHGLSRDVTVKMPDTFCIIMERHGAFPKLNNYLEGQLKMKYRHFVTGENLKQGVFFVFMEISKFSMELNTRSINTDKIAIFRCVSFVAKLKNQICYLELYKEI